MTRIADNLGRTGAPVHGLSDGNSVASNGFDQAEAFTGLVQDRVQGSLSRSRNMPSTSTEKSRKVVWHYTHGGAFNGIKKDRMIRQATAFVPANERPITWFTTEQYWEPTVTKGKILPDGTIKNLDMSGLLAAKIKLYRIGVDPDTAPYRWSELKELSGMHPIMATALASVARDQNANPSRWRGTFDSVPEEKWVAVETFDGRDWVPVS